MGSAAVVEKIVRLDFLDKNGRVLVEASIGRFEFRSDAIMDEAPNTMIIKAHGMTESDMEIAVTRAVRVLIYAGVGEVGLIAAGEIASARIIGTKKGLMLVVVGVDGDSLMTARVSRSITAGISLSGMARECIASSGVAADIGFISPKLDMIRNPRGVTVNGLLMDVLSDIAKAIDAAVFIRNGLIYIVCCDELIGDPAVISEQGLLTEPSLEGDVLHVVYEVDSKVRVGGVADFRGSRYRVLRVTANGDTDENMWSMSIEMTRMGALIEAPSDQGA